jgi:hypothetical protein
MARGTIRVWKEVAAVSALPELHHPGLDIVVFIYYKLEIELLLTYTSPITSVVYAAYKC